ncbi:MAG: ATP-dependent zinc protease [Alphaproteobacteria bacterium]|nr:ATP-dependent zinc protease [Alphaproteobacteria bacterium]
MLKISCLLSLVLLVSCSAQKKEIVVPGIVPHEVKEVKAPEVIAKRPANVIGAVEKIYLPPMKSAFLSRIDTGATTSSLDADSIRTFERDGKSWVAFTITNRESKETYEFEKPLVKKIKVKRILADERRPIVEMDVKMGGESFKADFTIAERENFEYQMLIGRNILSGRAIVDVSISNTLK